MVYTSYMFLLCDLSHPDKIVRSYILIISVVDPVGSASFWRILIQIRISICGLQSLFKKKTGKTCVVDRDPH
jgi:hypothetical protein